MNFCLFVAGGTTDCMVRYQIISRHSAKPLPNKMDIPGLGINLSIVPSASAIVREYPGRFSRGKERPLICCAAVKKINNRDNAKGYESSKSAITLNEG